MHRVCVYMHMHYTFNVELCQATVAYSTIFEM